MEEKAKTIRVSGKGAIHIVPDVTRLELTLKTLHETYEEAYEMAKQNTNSLARIMKEANLDKALPKTTSFDIDKKMESQYDKYDKYIGKKFVGFELDHRVKIDIGMDNELLNTVIRLIGRELKQAEISIIHTVRDERPAQLLMLERAVKDAKEKAEIMAKAAGCSLGEVKEINYSVQEIHIYSQARMIHSADEAVCCNTGSLDITPDDLAVSDGVTVEWNLVQ